MPISKRIGAYLRQQHLAIVAVFLVAAGGTAFAVSAPKNSIKSDSVKDNSLRSKDLKNGRGVTGADVTDDSLSGLDVDERSLDLSTLELTPRGPAGGALTGQYPSPQLAPNSVGSAQITNDDVLGADIAEGTLGRVPSALTATQGGLGRYGFAGSCDPESTDFIPCSTVRVPLEAPARLLVIGTVRAMTEADSDRAYGSCGLWTPAGPVAASIDSVDIDDDGNTDNVWESMSMIAVTDTLASGVHDIEVRCKEQVAAGFPVRYPQARVVAIALSGA